MESSPADASDVEIEAPAAAAAAAPLGRLDPADEALASLLRVFASAGLRAGAEGSGQEEAQGEGVTYFDSREELREHLQGALRTSIHEHVLGARAAARRVLHARTPLAPSPLPAGSPSIDAMLRPWGRRHNPANDASSAHARPQASDSRCVTAEYASQLDRSDARAHAGAGARECARWLEDYVADFEGTRALGDSGLDYLPPGLPRFLYNTKVEREAPAPAGADEEAASTSGGAGPPAGVISIGDVMNRAPAWPREDADSDDGERDEDEDEEEEETGECARLCCFPHAHLRCRH